MLISLSVRRKTFEKWEAPKQKEYLAKHPHSRFKKGEKGKDAKSLIPKVKLAPIKTRIKNINKTVNHLKEQRNVLLEAQKKKGDKDGRKRRKILIEKVTNTLKRLQGFKAQLHKQLKKHQEVKTIRKANKIAVKLNRP